MNHLNLEDSSDVYVVFIKSKLLDLHPIFLILSHQVFILITLGAQGNVVTYHCRTDTFKYSFFPRTILEWNKLDLTLRKSSYKVFRNSLLKMIRPLPNPVYDLHNPLGLRLLTRLRLGLSHLNEHKFNHNFKNCVNPLCTCSLEIESASHFFLHCDHYNNIRSTLLNKLNSLDGNILKLPDTTLPNLILYGGSQST